MRSFASLAVLGRISCSFYKTKGPFECRLEGAVAPYLIDIWLGLMGSDSALHALQLIAKRETAFRFSVAFDICLLLELYKQNRDGSEI